MSADPEEIVYEPVGAPGPSRRRARRFQRALIVLVALVVVSATGARWMVGARNELVALDVDAETRWSQVENQLLRQYELLPKLVAVAKRYAEHEREVLGELARARASYLDAAPRRRPEVASQVDGLLVGFLAVAENYPDLKANRQYRDLAFEIAGTKNRIAVERGRYNETVGVLNTRLRQVPWMFVAQRIDPRSYMEVDQSKLVEPPLEI